MAVRNPSAIPAIERIARLAWRIAHGEAITRAQVEREFGVSRATAKRDMALLARVLYREGPLPPGYQPARKVARPGLRIVPLLSGGDD